ncbi:hypothetical protein A21D_00716 [Virgibacillus dokdonensis]|uniref:HTH-like domain-containing protein n=1 Tax=Virgibacillus dokdonensis TaxID=302167 RepID=A0A2K9IVL1_9BACI|nr:hypothetical protein A21D_00716 [Virgibacillus dokdonensis]
MIRNNAHKYSVSAMCDVLNIPKSTYYYHADLTGKRAKKAEDKELSKEIARIFKEDSSFGFRPGRNCHDALKILNVYLEKTLHELYRGRRY